MADTAKTAKRGWLGVKRQADAAKQARASRRGDLTVAALGLTLGLICALFPWYIFFNQEKFGPQGGGLGLMPGLGGGPSLLSTRGKEGDEARVDKAPVDELDLFATGTAPERPEDEKAEALPASAQPLPAAAPRFRVVFIENGRAMIEDETGLFVVGRGDLLPDSSRVAQIVKREGRMVVVTSKDQVLEISGQ